LYLVDGAHRAGVDELVQDKQHHANTCEEERALGLHLSHGGVRDAKDALEQEVRLQVQRHE
jgi:hypothetical protein